MAIATPILQTFDYFKTLEFYFDCLGFTIDWEHGSGDNSSILYAGVIIW